MERKSRIAQLAPLWIPIPPRTYGGIELMLSELTEELVRRGYDITLDAGISPKIYQNRLALEFDHRQRLAV